MQNRAYWLETLKRVSHHGLESTIRSLSGDEIRRPEKVHSLRLPGRRGLHLHKKGGLASGPPISIMFESCFAIVQSRQPLRNPSNNPLIFLLFFYRNALPQLIKRPSRSALVSPSPFCPSPSPFWTPLGFKNERFVYTKRPFSRKRRFAKLSISGPKSQPQCHHNPPKNV